MAAIFKVSRGSYSKMKTTLGKNNDTLYFGYDNDQLKGIFQGDKELTLNVKDIVFQRNEKDSKYIDLILYKYNETSNKLVKTTCTIYNTNILNGILSNIQSMLANLQKDVIDISTRLNTFSKKSDEKHLSFENADKELKQMILDVSNKKPVIDTSGNTIINQTIKWIDLD